MGSLEPLLKKADGISPIIVSDGVLSMEGTIAPLPELTLLAEKYGAVLYIDDAHARASWARTAAALPSISAATARP